MNIAVEFVENDKVIDADFGEVTLATDGGFERGYSEGYDKGYSVGVTDGVEAGSTAGLEALFLKNIKSFKSDKVVSVEQYTFMNCTQLEELDLPSLSAVSNSMCRGCVKLKRVRLLHMTGEIGSNAFQECSELEYADIGTATAINAAAFYNCRALSTLIIRSNILTPLKQNFRGTFYDSPLMKGTGFVYVPDNLVEQYKTATNWSDYATQIKPLSEL